MGNFFRSAWSNLPTLALEMVIFRISDPFLRWAKPWRKSIEIFYTMGFVSATCHFPKGQMPVLGLCFKDVFPSSTNSETALGASCVCLSWGWLQTQLSVSVFIKKPTTHIWLCCMSHPIWDCARCLKLPSLHPACRRQDAETNGLAEKGPQLTRNHFIMFMLLGQGQTNLNQSANLWIAHAALCIYSMPCVAHSLIQCLGAAIQLRVPGKVCSENGDSGQYQIES